MRINARGLPHSEIPGSKPVCGLPELIAAYHVLHRHLAPRHSPYALSSLTIDMRTNVVVPDSFCVLSSGVNPSRHTACVFFVVGKNYRLQDIQLSKSRIYLEIWKCCNLEISKLPDYQISKSQHGGEYRARTGDLLVANQALSQLS